ncbi:proteasome assembly chaperone family protein [Halobium salinum]|uniref:Proteasome assembly chaperone family protein n=1 Tax=Halobium salinum TaxID=1364940 RepID=A0ABD5P727_9EURY|nr:PAC2 family protein [Halobium salinum]
MAHIDVLDEGLALDAPYLVEGLPGVGLVGKIAADHLVEEFEMTHYANVLCDGLPRVAVYQEGDADLRPPVRLYADEERGLVVLQSDVPVHPQAATEFAECIDGWLDEHSVVPIYLSGIGREKDEEPPVLYGVASGEGHDLLSEAGVDAPAETGVVTGPTGALMNHAIQERRTAVGLIVESDPQFPDPEAARKLITDGIGPLAGVDAPTEDLVEHAEEIRDAKQRLAQRMGDGEQAESTQAKPLGMYQ